jgi:hypothetical protein
MTDIYLAIAIVSVVSLLLGSGAYLVARQAAKWVSILIAAGAAGLIVLNIAHLRHSLWPVRLLPVSNMIVYADPTPELGAILGGAALVLMSGTFWRKMVLVGPLLGLCLWGSFGVCFGTKPPMENRWRRGICLQTSMSSCSAAAAATLLRTHGIATTEAEMAELCLTNLDGTSPRGVYRGLKIKTEGTAWAVKVFHGDLATLQALKEPVLLTMELVPKPGIDPRYQEQWGWAPGVAHSVVVLRSRPDDRFDMGDPSRGYEVWDHRAIETLWKGDGLMLVRR